MTRYRLIGLDCAVCARNMETEVAAVAGVSSVSIDFGSLSMHIEAKDLGLVESKMKTLEPGITLERLGGEANSGYRKDNQPAALIPPSPGTFNLRRELIFLALAIALGLVGILLERGILLEKGFLLPGGAVNGKLAGTVLILIAWFLAGRDVLYSALRNILRGRVFDELFLMSIATIGAIILGQFEEALEVMAFFKVGEMLQESAAARSRKAIGALLDLRPEFARVKRGDAWIELPPAEAAAGDELLLKPGERLALDAEVLEGNILVDMSALTGESMPREISPGTELLAGCVALDGSLRLRALRAAGDSQVARILALVEEAAHAKSRTEKGVTSFASVYTPIVLALALALAFLPPLFIPGQSLAAWVYRALVMLVISCPCALVISVPLGYFGGIGGAARRGILVKGGKTLDALARIGTVIFDKTGTLTEGSFRVLKIQPAGLAENEVLSLAAGAESLSRHPLAASIRAAAQERGLDAWLEDEVSGLKEISGAGVVAFMGGKRVAAGNRRLLDLEGVSIPDQIAPGIGASDNGATCVHIAVDGVWAGCIELGDAPRADALHAIEALRGLRINRICLLTGDSPQAAAPLASSLGIDEWHASLLPQGKLECLHGIREASGGAGVAFVGDGINDAPVIAAADVGIAMGAGSDAAVECADLVLLTDQPSRVAEAIGRGRKTRRIIAQNIVLALGTKALVLSLAALGEATMWEAVLADVGVALLAIANSLRALR